MAKTKLQIEYWNPDKLVPYDKNAKIHTESQVKSLADVIRTQGWDVPIVVDRHGVIIKGHGRRLAALHLGLKEVPVLVRTDLTDAEVKAARLSDNRVAMGDFDVDSIRDELAGLRADGFDLSTTGFGEKEIQMMLGELDAINFDVFEDQAETHTSASQSTPEPVQASEATPDAPKDKALLVTDLLGFKHISAEYKDDLIQLIAEIELSTGLVGAEAFGKFVRTLVDQIAGSNGA